MKIKLWYRERSPKELFEQLIKKQPNSTFWDILPGYSPIYLNEIINNLEKEWNELKKTIHKIGSHINKPLKSNQIDELLYAIEEFSFSENENQVVEIPIETKKQGKEIAEIYIIPLKMEFKIKLAFFNELEKFLYSKNSKYHIELQKQEEIDPIRSMENEPGYSKENTKYLIKDIKEAYDELLNVDEEKPSEESNFDNFISPSKVLNISESLADKYEDENQIELYNKQEKIVYDTFYQYVDEISELLKQNPDKNLQPNLNLDSINTDELDEKYFNCMQQNPFMYEFKKKIVSWEKEGKVLSLTLEKPEFANFFSICLIGLSLEKFIEVLNKYNNIAK